RSERRASLRLLEDTFDTEVEEVRCRCLDPNRRADVEVMLLRELVVDERPVTSESCWNSLVAFLPGQVDDLREARIHPGQIVGAAEVAGRAGANRGDRGDVGRLRKRLLRVDGERVEGVRRREGVVALEELVDRALERRADALAEYGHERHEREPDHER